MIVSYNWLKTLIPFDLTPDELSVILTNTGLEVEKLHKIESIKGGLAGLVVGEVISCSPAKNSDNLKVTSINIGSAENLPIVCGAPNVKTGQKVVIATVGTTIYPLSGESFKIKKAKIRGNVSEGMICAEDEIGVGSDHDGIIVLDENAAPGTALRDIIDLNEDYQIEIGLTPNRGDAASHLGTARDIQAMTDQSVALPEVGDITNTSPSSISVNIEDAKKCPRYTGIILNNISVGESPAWLKERLQAIDINPINNVVDTTNFVLHELGQPIHAFDANNIEGDIHVRTAKPDETLTTLDGIERKLNGVELLIADDNKPLALAGVFGGNASGVSNETTTVFIESAYFDPSTIRRAAKHHGLNTDASFRYERGCDPNITDYALRRVVDILKEVANAKVGSAILDVYPNKIDNHSITFNTQWLNDFCGIQISDDKIKNILTRLDIDVTKHVDHDITVSVLPYRSDVLRPIDIAEEVLRIYGFNQVEIPTRLSMTPSVRPSFNPSDIKDKVAQFLVSKGFYETMSNSQTKKNDRTDYEFVELLNPLSIDQSVMRTDMLDGIMSSIGYNINRKNKDLLFFEFGKTYVKTASGYGESNQLILATSGSGTNKNWNTESEPADYFYLKGVFEALADSIGLPPKKLLKIISFETLSKSLRKEYSIKQDVHYAVLNWDDLLQRLKSVKFKLEDVPLFPIVSRDLSLVLNKSVEYAQVERIVKESAGAYFNDLTLFDVYEGKNIEEGKKSYAISIKLYNAEQTMTDDKIDNIMRKMMARLEKDILALIRK
ncbi:MAG: phenylalanyl-tRNA synthetase beta chain [Bacteroidia bacterium]|jgi:phenylalanyl-tRNA synthetase beta chain